MPNNSSNYDLKSLMNMAKNKTPDELLGSLPQDQAKKIKDILSNKQMTEKILKSKQAQDIMKKMK